jgi:hypothetical protein
MSVIISFQFLVLLYCLVRSLDIAISSAIAHDVGRAILYVLLALLLILGALHALGLAI